MKIVNLEAEINRTCHELCGRERKDCKWTRFGDTYWPEETCSVIQELEKAQTVEAIPVEWLEWRIEHAEREGFVEVARMLQTVRDWWNDQKDLWREEKEQEAR